MTISILNAFSKSLPWPPHRKIGAVCLLMETNRGLLLVDTGLGLHDYAHPVRMMRDFRKVMRAVKDPDLAVTRQVVRLGGRPEDVRDIVLTHLHLDHAGGLPDFPYAQVHVYRMEYEAMCKPRGLVERMAYNKPDFAHGPQWVLHDAPDAKWYDFDAIRLDFEPEMVQIPLPGHTRGHCGVAVRDGDGWLFHAADALPTNAQFDLLPAWIYMAAIGPHVPRLKAFAVAHPEVRLIAGHMWLDWFEKEAAK